MLRATVVYDMTGEAMESFERQAEVFSDPWVSWYLIYHHNDFGNRRLFDPTFAHLLAKLSERHITAILVHITNKVGSRHRDWTYFL